MVLAREEIRWKRDEPKTDVQIPLKVFFLHLMEEK